MTTPPRLLTSSVRQSDEAIAETGTLKTLKAKFDSATDPIDRIGLGLHYQILALLDREYRRWEKERILPTGEQIIEGLAQGCCYGVFNAFAQMALQANQIDGSDMNANIAQACGDYMMQQQDFFIRLIEASTIPEGTTRQ